MPKMVTELAQGNTFGRSADGGSLADQAQRVFKVLLSSPDEQFDILGAIGVGIGDPYSQSNPIPCVSVEGRADGDSRLVRIVTATYRTTAGGDGSEDPKQYNPDIRPANFSTSTTLYERPAYQWRKYPDPQNEGATRVINATKDPIDGVSVMDAITTIRITQFDTTPGTIHSQHCGKINKEQMNLGSYMTCAPHTVLFRGVEAQPHVETFGNLVVRGFMNTYEFSYRPNEVTGFGYCGWDVVVPNTGFSVYAFNPANAGQDKDPFGQPLDIDDDTKKIVFDAGGNPKLPAGVQAGKKQRAMVRAGDYQNPSAQPIALNDDGTPRNTETANPPVIAWRRQVQEEVDLTSTLKLRLQ